MHGPICVDWDGDGMPDDWEIAHGLDPTWDDSRLDPDKDGLTNREEYEQGTDPLNPDTDGDGVCDGDEGIRIDHQAEPTLIKHVKQPLRIISSDNTGMTLDLHSETFERERISAEDKNKLLAADPTNFIDIDEGSDQPGSCIPSSGSSCCC